MFGGNSRLRCDACGNRAPDAVAPILFGMHGWREFGLDGEIDGRPWEGTVLLCDDTGGGLGWRATGKGCASRMAAFIDSGGRAGQAGPKPPNIQTFRGGRDTEPKWLAVR